MATSGSYDYSVTASDLITEALQNIGFTNDEPIDSADQALALKQLNLLIKQKQGIANGDPGWKIFSRQRVTMFLAKGQQTYTVGPNSTDARATTQYGRTTISVAEAAGQTTISITSNTDATTQPGTTVTMTNADIVGIQLDDGTLQWTTISGTPSTTMVITNALTTTAAAGNYVYWFTSRAQRFPVLEYAVLRNEDIIDVPLQVYTDVQQYERLADKTAQGDPCSILVEPYRLYTQITTDFQPWDVTKQVRMTVLYPAEDYDAVTNDIAFPQERFLEIAWELSFRLCPKFGMKWTQEMQMNYELAVGIGRNLNPENSSIYFQPGRDYAD